MKRIFLDTNFVLDTVQWKIDLFGELSRVCDFAFETVVLDRVLEELESVKARGGRKKELANVALLVLSKSRITVLNTTSTSSVDSLLVKLADKNDFVATQDQALKRRLRQKGVPVVVIREKGYLQLVGV